MTLLGQELICLRHPEDIATVVRDSATWIKPKNWQKLGRCVVGENCIPVCLFLSYVLKNAILSLQTYGGCGHPATQGQPLCDAKPCFAWCKQHLAGAHYHL